MASLFDNIGQCAQIKGTLFDKTVEIRYYKK
jgi:hypothetical protein